MNFRFFVQSPESDQVAKFYQPSTPYLHIIVKKGSDRSEPIRPGFPLMRVRQRAPDGLPDSDSERSTK